METDTSCTLGDADAALEAEAAISDRVLRLAGIALLALDIAGAYAILTA